MLNEREEDELIHQRCEVQSRVSLETTGTVLVPIRDGTQIYFARPTYVNETFNLGDIVRITSFTPPRTVRVTALKDLGV